MNRRSFLQAGLFAASEPKAACFDSSVPRAHQVDEGGITFGSAGHDLAGAATFHEINDLLGTSGKWEAALPYRSQMDRIREEGITPDDVVGTIVSGDAGRAIAGMFFEGIRAGVNRFKLMSGKTYNVSSWDPTDVNRAVGVLRLEETSDVVFDLNGGTLKGFSGIQGNLASPGAIMRFESAYTKNGADTTQRFILKNGKIDLTNCAPSSPGRMTIGGLSMVGRWNIELDGILFDHGRTLPQGDAIGVGGGDQSFFASNWNALKISRCIFRGAPDLGVYLSNSGGRRADIISSDFIGCQNAVGLKRFASLLRISGCQIREGDIGIYNPPADGLANNMGGRMHIERCLIEKMQSWPIDINALADGSSVRNTEIWDWGRRLSDGIMTSRWGSISAIRVRSRRVMIQNVRMGLRDWALNGSLAGESTGKEQVGIVYGYNGANNVSEGAADSMHSDCYFENLLRRVHYEAKTYRNADGKGNRSSNIALPDLDNGDNIFPVRLMDDQAASFVVPTGCCLAHFECPSASEGSPNGDVHVNTVVPAVANVNLKSDSAIAFTTGALYDGDGIDDKMNLSAHADGKLYISNRTGSTVRLHISFPRE